MYFFIYFLFFNHPISTQLHSFLVEVNLLVYLLITAMLADFAGSAAYAAFSEPILVGLW